MAVLGGFASKMGLASGTFVGALLLSDGIYALLVNIAIMGLLACMVVVIPPALSLNRR
ncbi:MAG: hypothetical protein V7746_24280 [Halioglobus sp.]